MILDRILWNELVEIGVLTGEETCLRCGLPPAVLWDNAHAPVLLCLQHARELHGELGHDMQCIESERAEAAGGHERR